MRKWLLILWLALLPLTGWADIYRIVDKEGHVAFTDKPQKGATKINLQPQQSYSSPNTNTKSSESSTLSSLPTSASTSAPTSKGVVSYEQLQIISPTDQANIQNTGGQIEVTVALAPKLHQGDKLVIALNDEPIAEASEPNTSFVLQNVPRGTHHLQAYIMGPDTHILKSSDVITVYVHQGKAATPAVQNSRINGSP